MLQKCNIFRVAGIFFEEPTKTHYLLEISRKSGMAHTSVKRYLQDLKDMSIINENIEKKGERKFPVFIANLYSKAYKENKRMYNLTMIRKSGLVQFLKDKTMPKAIVLFGSYFKGEDIESSDIDIFLECNNQKINVSLYEKKLKRKIQLHFNKDFNKYPAELKNNIINGLVLEGYLEAF